MFFKCVSPSRIYRWDSGHKFSTMLSNSNCPKPSKVPCSQSHSRTSPEKIWGLYLFPHLDLSKLKYKCSDPRAEGQSTVPLFSVSLSWGAVCVHRLGQGSLFLLFLKPRESGHMLGQREGKGYWISSWSFIFFVWYLQMWLLLTSDVHRVDKHSIFTVAGTSVLVLWIFVL